MLIVVGRREPSVFTKVAEVIGKDGLSALKLLGAAAAGGAAGGIGGKLGSNTAGTVFGRGNNR